MLLSRDAILAAPIPTSDVEVPEWGGTVRIRALSARARVDLLDAIYANDAAHTAWKEDQALPEGEREGLPRVDLYEQAILTVIFGIVDENGDQMFSVADYDAFAELDYQTIVSLWQAMQEHARRDPESLKKIPRQPGKALPLPPRARARQNSK
ncbi:hypothetical protein [Sphingomonas sanguinis]|uniref:hypothetical protein n=1 Tax=Sphingomonas sanguinis TaxID=33051 RepID=UPI0030196161